MITKTKTKKINSSIQSDRDKIKAKIQFQKEFVKQDLQVKRYTFTEKDLPLIEYFSSEEVNSNNRGKTDDNTRRLYRCLDASKWHAEACLIMISREGVLMNGQHTFEAFNQWFRTSKKSKCKKISAIFLLGVHSDAMPYIDTAKKRSPHQNLRIKQGGVNVKLNRIQEFIVLTEGKRVIHGSPFARSGQVNFFEYEDVIKKHSSMLTSIFSDRSFCSDFPLKAIGYALFCLAKEDQELAESIMDDICKKNDRKDGVMSKYSPSKSKQHELVELFREEKALRETQAYQKLKNVRDGYRQEDFYPLVVDYLVKKHKINSKVFPL